MIDTNIFLEFLLGQEREAECVTLLRRIEEGIVEASVTSFALHSIEVVLERVRKIEGLVDFLDWVTHAQGLSVYQTSPDEERQIALLTERVGLDFDDAVQYYVTETLQATLVSFDSDFDRTDITRVEPRALLL